MTAATVAPQGTAPPPAKYASNEQREAVAKGLAALAAKMLGEDMPVHIGGWADSALLPDLDTLTAKAAELGMPPPRNTGGQWVSTQQFGPYVKYTLWTWAK